MTKAGRGACADLREFLQSRRQSPKYAGEEIQRDRGRCKVRFAAPAEILRASLRAARAAPPAVSRMRTWDRSPAGCSLHVPTLRDSVRWLGHRRWGEIGTTPNTAPRDAPFLTR